MESVLLPSQMALVVAVVYFFFCSCCHICVGQSPIPAKYDGFLYKGVPLRVEDSILVEAFFDPLCPDSRDAWPPLKQALDNYAPRLSLIVHPFPLPYHDNAFVACRALHIANMLNTSTTYPLLELLFKHQGNYHNKRTSKMSRTLIVKHMEKLAVEAIGNSSLPAFKNGFENPKTDRAARNSFNYGCSRGVTGTPFFFVNGFPLPGSGSAIAYSKWLSIIDPLLSEHTTMAKEEPSNFFF